MAARGDMLDSDRTTVFDDYCVVEIIYGRTDVAGDQVEQFANHGHVAAGDLDGQMFLARLQRNHIRSASDCTCRHARVGGNAFMACIAGDYVGFRMAHYGRDDQRRGLISPLCGQLLDAGRVAVYDCSRRGTMDEFSFLKRSVVGSERKRGGAAGDHFFKRKTGAFDGHDDLHQTVVSFVCELFTLLQRRGGHVAVVVMQASELRSGGANDVYNFGDSVLRNTGAIHARIYVDENSDAASGPHRDLLDIFD